MHDSQSQIVNNPNGVWLCRQLSHDFCFKPKRIQQLSCHCTIIGASTDFQMNDLIAVRDDNVQHEASLDHVNLSFANTPRIRLPPSSFLKTIGDASLHGLNCDVFAVQIFSDDLIHREQNSASARFANCIPNMFALSSNYATTLRNSPLTRR